MLGLKGAHNTGSVAQIYLSGLKGCFQTMPNIRFASRPRSLFTGIGSHSEEPTPTKHRSRFRVDAFERERERERERKGGSSLEIDILLVGRRPVDIWIPPSRGGGGSFELN